MNNEILKSIILSSKENSIDNVSQDRVNQLVEETEKKLGKELTGYSIEDKPYNQYYTEEMLADKYPRNRIGLEILSRSENIQDKIAFRCDKNFTYKQLREESIKYAYILKNKYNIKKGDYILMDVLSTPDAICAFIAANIIGARLRPIDPIYGVDQISKIIDEYNPKLSISNALQYSSMKKAIGERNIPVSCILMKGYMPFVSKAKQNIINTIEKVNVSIMKKKSKSWSLFNDEISSLDGKVIKLDEVAEEYVPNEIAEVFPTSGTTGEAKGVEVTNENFLSNVYKEYISDFGVTEEDSLFNPMPTCSSFFWYTIALAAFLGVTTSLSPLFDAKNSPKQIADDESTWVLLGPIIINSICDYIEQKKIDEYNNFVEMIKDKLLDTKKTQRIESLKSKKKLVSGGDLLQLDLEKRAVNLGLNINNNLGTSENTGPCTNPNGGMTDGRGYYLGCVGVPLPGNEVAIFKYDIENNMPEFNYPDYNKGLKYYEVGEICYNANNPNVFKDYYNNDKATNETKLYHSDGSYWYHSGDLGYMDPAGHVFCCGRKSGLIVRDGHKVWAPKIEIIGKEQEGIKDFAIIGVENDVDKEVPVAFVVYEDNVNEEMKNVIKNNVHNIILKELDSKHLPYSWYEIDSIPRNLMMKTKIGELKELYKELSENENTNNNERISFIKKLKKSISK